ncbi:MAG: hypothetical protein J7K75_10810 [Desulfuromonas sp.]|nr:hypothetical protein [Desulfuromonas sp.]
MSFITSILTIILAVTILLSAQLYFMQDGMIFLGAKLSSQTLAELRSRFADSELRLTSADGTKLHGWYLQAKGNQPAPLLIYFGGNAEDITHMLFEQHHFQGYSLLLIIVPQTVKTII